MQTKPRLGVAEQGVPCSVLHAPLGAESATALASPAHATTELPEEVTLRLLNGFAIAREDEVLDLPLSVQRLVIFLSLQERPLHRARVAGTLWPETIDQRAGANLRSALWRLNQLGCGVIKASGACLQISRNVRVDLHETVARAHQVLFTEEGVDELDTSSFCFDLLPGWYDDWLIIEQERFHQLRLRALECVCERLTECGQYARALEAGLAAVAAEPLRESAHRALIKVHLAEGNRAEGVRQFHFYEKLLHDEIGLAPSQLILDLLQI